MSVVKPQQPWSARPRAIASSSFRGLAVLALVCALAACSKQDAASDVATATPGAVSQVAAPPPQAVSAKVAAMSAEQLRDAAGAALREQRLYAPAGDNAMEYYLALRDKQPNDPAVFSALTDLLPYALIATEQSIGREDFSEAQRLYALMEKTDAQAPALPRLKQTIAAQQQAVAQRTVDQQAQSEVEAKRLAEQDKQRQQDQQKAQQQAAQQLAQQQASEREAARAAAEREASERAAAQQAQQQQAAAKAAAPAAAASELRAISTPAPRYPPEALRAGQSGDVQVEFTVGTDGSVTAARVVRSNPPRVFDREAVAAVKRWKFQPVSAPVTTRRTIGFNPGG
jgi:protein TonB